LLIKAYNFDYINDLKQILSYFAFLSFLINSCRNIKPWSEIIFAFVLSLCSVSSAAQHDLPASWRAHLVRQDSNEVIFTIETKKENGEIVFYVINDEERLRIHPVRIFGDSVHFDMPAFESYFRTKKNKDGSLQGIWIKGTSGVTQQWNFYAVPGQTFRFEINQGKAKQNISGRWDVNIKRRNGTFRKATAEFKQKGNKLTGTFLTPTGDYRYLDGVVTGDSLKLSTFDGAHAYAFSAKIINANKITGGVFYSGFAGVETWEAEKNNAIGIPEQEQPTMLRNGESGLNFTFNDLYGNPVSINDERYKNKVVIVQLLGSWCPNCMDETKFLSEYYNSNMNRGVEVIGLAYEYDTSVERSKKSLKKFEKLFNVQYPLLITGATSSDEHKTEKTLPQLTPIRSFPTTIFIDKKGKVRKIKGVFYGPGTGEFFEKFRREFYDTIDQLLAEE
jgi:thiol-disulfide isomerase/thioredoxin